MTWGEPSVLAGSVTVTVTRPVALSAVVAWMVKLSGVEPVTGVTVKPSPVAETLQCRGTSPRALAGVTVAADGNH